MFFTPREALTASMTRARNVGLGTLAATGMEAVKEDCGTEFTTHRGGEGTEDWL